MAANDNNDRWWALLIAAALSCLWFDLTWFPERFWLTAAAKAKGINWVACAAVTTAIWARSRPQRECTLQLTHSNAKHNNNSRLTLALSPARLAYLCPLHRTALLSMFAIGVARICMVFVCRCKRMQVKLILMCFYGVSCFWKLLCVQVVTPSGVGYERKVVSVYSVVSKWLMQVVVLSFSLCALIESQYF